MKREQLLRLIKESRELMQNASTEQKLRLITLIREGYHALKKDEQQLQVVQELLEQKNLDYLDEK